MNFRAYIGRTIAVAAFAFVGMMSIAAAQSVPVVDDPLIQRGDAVVTGFSGVIALKPKPNAKLEDYLIIDTQAPALQVFDLSQMFGGDNARLVDAPRLHAVPAGQIGQVFGVALDDGRPADGVDDGRDPVPNIYATATSAYGLQLVETKQVGKGKVRERAKLGSPDVNWMDGQFGVGGGPGSIWRIDGRTGEASLFADVTFDGVANSAPALGAITFDPVSRRLYVSDLQTGMIHAFDLTGAEVDRYDHGVQGRPAEGLTEVAFDPASRVEITSPAFNAEDPKTWGFAPRERKVWGLAVHNRRLFYSVDDGPTIWSIGLRQNGEFAKDARAEIDVRTKSGDAISALAFSRGGTIYLSQRGATVPTYDYQVMATPQTAQTLRYKRETLPNGDVVWRVLAEEYAIGQSGEHRSSNGGVALGYGYDANGFIRHDVCEGTVWTTGEILRQTAQPDPLLTAGGETVVQGLQGTPTGAVMPNNAPPMQSFYIDYDRQFLDPGFRGHMGQVAIWGCDGRPRVSAAPAPAPRPHGPHIKIAKKCSSAGFGNRMHCRVTLFNAGDEAPVWPVGFSDEADIRHGPANASRIRIVSATPSHPGWKCSAVPTSEFGCEIDGELLRPGRRRFVDVVMDVSGIASTPGFRVRNCAFLDDESDFACTSGGEDLIVQKTGDRLCEAGQFCTFDLSVTNFGRRTFDGRLFLADNISLPGVPALDVAFISPPIPGCDPATLPFQCNVPMTLGPGRSRTFVVTVEIPRNAVRPGRTVQGRNCFFASDPGLIPDGGRRRVSFLKATLKTLNPNSPSAGPGFECFKFTVQAPGMGTIPPRCDVPVARLRVTPTPASFNAANQKIKVEVAFTNTGNNKFEAIEDWKVAAPQLKNLTCASQRHGLDPRTFALCKGEYTTKATDFGKPIELTATATGDSACGKIAAVRASGTVAFTGAPVLVLAATPSPATYKAANEKIAYTYIVKNTGSFPIPLFSLNGGKATDVKCAAGGPVLSFSACASSNSTCAKLAAGASLTCTGSYTTKASDVGKDIVTTARAEGGTTMGAIGQLNPKPDLVAAPVKLLVKYAGPPVAPPLGTLGNPAMTLAVTPSPATFSTSNQKITYNYTLNNTGTVPFTFYGFKDTVATDVKCSGPAVQAKLCAQAVAGSGFCGSLAVGASTTCTGSYTTKPGDIGKDLASKVSFTGKIDADPNSVDVSGETDAVVKYTASPSAQPKLEITKYTPKSATFAAANEKIAYHYIISNIGDAALTSFTLTDNRVTGLKCQPKSAGPQGGPMAPGQALSCSGTYTTTAADVGKDIASTATVTATVDTSLLQSIQNIFASPASSLTATANAVVKFNTNPGATAANSTLGIAATVSPSSYLGPNEKLTYSYKVTNNGSVPLTSFTLAATKATGIKCSPGNGPKGGPLAPGAIATCTGSYTTQPVDVGAKVVASKVSVTATSAAGAVPPSRTATIDVAFKGSMAFTLAVTPVPATFSAAGQKITYSYTLKNTGNVPVTGLSLSESKPVAFDCPGPRGANGKGQSPDIAVGATLVCKRVYTTVAADLGKDIASTMTATGAFDIGNGTWRSGEQKKASAVVKFAAPVARPVATKPPELKVLHFAGALDATGKKQITFAGAKQRIDVLIQVFNHGGPATNLTVTGSKITDIKCTKPDAGAPFIGPTVGPVAAGTVTSCLAHYTTTAADVGKDFDLEAQVVATTPSGPVMGTPKKITVKFAGKPELKLSVRAEPDDYRAANKAITYTYTLDNIGPVPATSFAITDNKVTGIKCAPANTGAKGGPLAPGASVTCTGTYTTKPGDIPKSIINVASVTGVTAAGKLPPQTPANARVKFSGKPNLVAHTYQAKPGTFSAANQKIIYSYFIFNYGELPVASFSIADSKVKDIKCAPANSGASGGPIGITNGMAQCTGIYTTTAADVGKDIESEMTVSGTSVLGPIKPTPQQVKQATVTYKAPAEKPEMMAYYYVASQQTFSAAGEVITYTYDVANFGNVPITSFKLTDSKGNDIKCKPANTTNGGGLIGIRKLAHCFGTYTTTAADVGKDLESEMNTTGMTAAGPVPSKPHASKKVVVKFVAPAVPPVAAKPPDLIIIDVLVENTDTSVVDPRAFSAAKQLIDFQFDVYNLGGHKFTSVTVTSNKITGINCTNSTKANLAGPTVTPLGGVAFDKNVARCLGKYTTTAADVGEDLKIEVTPTAMTAAGPVPPKDGASKIRVHYFGNPELIAHSYTPRPATFSKANEKIEFSYNIFNYGAVPVKTFTITDSKVKNIKCPPKNAGPSGGPIAITNGDVICTGIYTTTAADVGKDIESEMTVSGTSVYGPIEATPRHVKKATVTYKASPAAVAQNFEMMQVKAVPSTFSAAGEKIDYVMIVKGNGAVPATATFMVTGKKISDIKCAPAYTSPVGRGPFTVVSDCKGSYTTTAADVGKDIESRAEVASITAAGMSPPTAAAAKTAVVKFAGKAAFDLHHECFPKVYASPGQVIGCEFVIRNTGTVPIQSCRITGSRLNAVCPTGMIPPGGSVLVKGSYTSTLADVGKNIVIDYKIEGLQQ